MSRLSRLVPLTLAGALLASCVQTPPPVVAVTPPMPSGDYTQLLEDVRILSADDMQGRDTGSDGGARARAYIISRFEALGVAPSPMGREQPFEAPGSTPEGVKTFNGVNILGQIPGTRVGGRWIVVTAHYDHVGVHGGQIFNGADDNASGVATMLELPGD